MSMELDPVGDRVSQTLKRLQLNHLRETLPAVLSEAAKADWKTGRFGLVPGDSAEFIPLPDGA